MPKPLGERAGGGELLQAIFQAPLRSTQAGSSPVSETRGGAVGGHAVVTCSTPFFPSAHTLYSFFYPEKRVAAPGGQCLSLA